VWSLKALYCTTPVLLAILKFFVIQFEITVGRHSLRICSSKNLSVIKGADLKIYRFWEAPLKEYIGYQRKIFTGLRNG